MRSTRSLWILLVLGSAACSNVSGLDSPPSDAGPEPPPSCQVGLTSVPLDPVAGPAMAITVVAHVVNPPGPLDHRWHVHFNGTLIKGPAPGDEDSINFKVPTPGVYDVNLTVTDSTQLCPAASLAINVRAPGAQTRRVRLRVTPPASVAEPPYERILVIRGGADIELDAAQPVQIEPGVTERPIVMGPGGGVPAYVRFSPNSAPDAIVEAFSDFSGAVLTRLVPMLYAVLIVPSIPGVAPRRITNWSPASSMLVLDAGTEVGGEVRDPAGAPIEGAKVTLTVDGVPSTLATTGADGAFTLRATTGSPVTVEVTPPATSGLPRLLATSPSGFDLGKPLAIRYAASLQRRDLAGAVVRQQGTPLASRSVTVVGSLPAIGTVTAGTSAPASGEVRITATTNASGALPTMLVPAAVLRAVVTVAAGDLAVANLDATQAVVGLEVPSSVMSIASVLSPSDAMLPGAIADLVPIGDLAMAGAPVRQVTANASGNLVVRLAAGGHYDLRLRDPRGRGALLVVKDLTEDSIAPSYRLPAALHLRGTVRLRMQALPNAAVQILCEDCTGIERARPLAEAVSDGAGRFELAVEDPGTM